MPEPQETRIGDVAEFQRRVAAALEKIRPMLQAHGGDISLLSVVGRDAHVRLTGACRGCPGAAATLRAGVEQFLRQEVPGFGDVIGEPLDAGPDWRLA